MKRSFVGPRRRAGRFGVGAALPLAVATIFLAAGVLQAGWEKVGGPKGVVVSRVLGGSLELYATDGPGLNPTGEIYAYASPNHWGKIGGPGSNFVVGPSTGLYPWLVRLNADKKTVWMWSYQWPNANTWIPIGGPAGQIYGGGAGIFATTPGSGELWRYGGKPPPSSGTFPWIDQQKWTMIGQPGKTFAVNDKDLFGLSVDGQVVFQYSGTPMKWVRIGGPAAELYAGGNKLFITQPNTGDIYRWDGQPFAWTKVGGPGRMFAVTAGGGLYGVSPNGKAVNRYIEGQGWVNIGGPGDPGTPYLTVVGRLYGGGLYLYATAPNGDLWRYVP